MKTWVLRKGAGSRFRSGHPWVFSNELDSSPKGLEPGALVQLVDHTGAFLANGYGNPQSLIAFRALSHEKDQFPDGDYFLSRFQAAASLRQMAGLTSSSHRLVFAEGDFLPGLIIDRYLATSTDSLGGQNPLWPMAQIFVIQISTAGMDHLRSAIFEGLEKFVQWEIQTGVGPQTNPGVFLNWSQTAIVMANTSSSRKLEGLKVEARDVTKPLENVNFSSVLGLFQSASEPSQNIPMFFDILGGQKTGFFLDQRDNIRRLIEVLKPTLGSRKSLRVLDLCSYVGHWSSQISRAASEAGLVADCLLYDASQEALDLAAKNVELNGGHAQTIKGDVLQPLRMVPDRNFDIVICDPPAFIKKKKDVPTGKAAYLKLNKEAQRRVANGGIFVSCSCSGLFESEEFRQTLARVSFGTQMPIQWVKQGFHSPDHPQRLEFPEGTYLKCLIGILHQS